MAQQPRKDNRYRGRQRQRTAPPRRKPGHLRTNYTGDDPTYFFMVDLNVVRAVWPPEVIEGDRKALRTRQLRTLGVTLLVVMVPTTIIGVAQVIDGMPWWILLALQTAVLLYMLVLTVVQLKGNKDEDVDVLIYREADRRGIKYEKGKTPLHNIMNRINYDYNTTLWNRNFKWK